MFGHGGVDGDLGLSIDATRFGSVSERSDGERSDLKIVNL